MGNFFSSPYERASTNMYDAAVSGNPIGSEYLKEAAGMAKGQLRAETSNRIGTAQGDILSQLASIGIAPGSGMTGAVQDKAIQPILAGSQTAEAGIDIGLAQNLAQMIMQQMGSGMAGMSKSSTFGDIFAGLTTVGTLGAGIAGMGGSKGFNWWGNTPSKTT